jgi:error-prone DNA polymerase
MGFYANHTILDEAKRKGVAIYPLDPRLSEWDCKLESKRSLESLGAIRVGWRLLNGLGETSAHKIIEERTQRPFQSFSDFLWRVSSWVKPPVLNALALGDAFRCFGYTPRQALWEILGHQVLSRDRPPAQLSLFASLDSPADQKLFKDLNEFETIRSDYQAYGVSTRGHPMEPLRKVSQLKLPPLTSSQIKKLKNGTSTRIAGLIIVRQRPPTAKGTCFATLEDEEGFLDLILHKTTFEKYRDAFNESPFMIVSGKLQKDGDTAMNLIVQNVQTLHNYFRVESRNFH